MELPTAAAAPVPAWIPLIPLAQFAGRDGRGPYVADEPAIRAQFAAWGMPLMGDYEHQGLYAPQNGQPAPASGSVAALEVRDGVLGGAVTWTERASAMIAAREYLYISPVFDHLPDGRVVRLTGWTLTNNPNLFLPAIATRESQNQEKHAMDADRASDLLKWLISDLGLPATSTAEDVQTHVQKIGAALSAAQAAITPLAATLGMPATTGVAAVATAAQARIVQSPDLTAFVPRAEYDRVAAAHRQLQDSGSQAAVDSLVTAAMTAGQIAPSSEAWARDCCARDPESFKRFLAGAPVVVAAHAIVPGVSPVRNETNPLLADAKTRKL